MFKKLDLYIIRKFLGTFVFALSLILVIVVVFDVSEKIDDFLEKQAPISEIITVYYFNFIPYFANLFSPLFTFIAVIFFTSKMASNTEIIAILSSGVSFNRILRPYVFSALLIGGFSFYLTNFLIPPTNQVRLNFEAQYLRYIPKVSDKDVHKQILPDVYIYFNKYNPFEQKGLNFFIEEHREDGIPRKLQANSIQWDSTHNKWYLTKVELRSIAGMDETLELLPDMDTVLGFTPDDLAKKENLIEAMDIFELENEIEKEKLRGSEGLVYLLVEKHKRMANPFATVILTLIGAALSSRKLRGGIGVHIGMGIAFSFAYILFMQVSTTFATSGNLQPAIAVWIPNIIFGLLALWMLKLAQK